MLNLGTVVYMFTRPQRALYFPHRQPDKSQQHIPRCRLRHENEGVTTTHIAGMSTKERRKGRDDTMILSSYFFFAAFSADLVTVGANDQLDILEMITDIITFPRLLSLINRLDNTDSNRLPHVTDSETTKRRIFIVALDTHGLEGIL